MPGPEMEAFIGLGGNIGNPAANMAAALRLLDAHRDISITAVSSLYRTPPWGKTDQPDFLNACAVIETRLAPRDLLEICLEIERELKRVRRERWGPRAIDIDLLAHSAGTIDDEGLSLPHPRMFDRAFVLVPLAEIAPELMIAGHTVAEWAKKTDASGMVVVKRPDWWRKDRGRT